MTTRVTPKKGQWKPIFLSALRRCANVSRSASEAEISRKTAYKERQDSTTFRDAWDDAIEEGLDYLEEEARRRAYEGTLEPVFYKGEHVGLIRKFSDTLTIFLLKGRRPDVYGDRLKQEVTGKNGGPIQQEVRANFDLAEDVRKLDAEISEAEEAEKEEGQA